MTARSGTERPLLADLTDDEVREVALSDWVQLTSVLSHELPSTLLSRMLRIELARGADARVTFVERIRGALMRSRTRESFAASVRIGKSILEQTVPAWTDLEQIGLETYDAHQLQTALESSGLSRLRN